MIADEKVFDLIPLKKEIKAEVSGLYIVGVKGIRGSLQTPAHPKRKVSLQNSRKTKLPDKCSQTYKLKVSESCHPYTQITDLFSVLDQTDICNEAENLPNLIKL